MPQQYHPESRLTPRQAAEVMGLSKSTVDKQRICGRGPAFEKLGRAVRYRHGSLLEWMTSQTRRSTSDSGVAA